MRCAQCKIATEMPIIRKLRNKSRLLSVIGGDRLGLDEGKAPEMSRETYCMRSTVGNLQILIVSAVKIMSPDC